MVSPHRVGLGPMRIVLDRPQYWVVNMSTGNHPNLSSVLHHRLCILDGITDIVLFNFFLEKVEVDFIIIHRHFISDQLLFDRQSAVSYFTKLQELGQRRRDLHDTRHYFSRFEPLLSRFQVFRHLL